MPAVAKTLRPCPEPKPTVSEGTLDGTSETVRIAIEKTLGPSDALDVLINREPQEAANKLIELIDKLENGKFYSLFEGQIDW